MRRLLGLVLLCLAPALVVAQDWRGEGRLRGLVLTAEGAPAVGAVVTVHRENEPGAGPPPVNTDAKGRWSVNGLAMGLWEITIDASGHIVSSGRVGVQPSSSSQSVEVRLRSLEEVSPYSTEGVPTAILGWIDKGNSYLRDGRYAEAREEYLLALNALPWEQHAELLQAIARTHYREGERELALETMHRALMVEPTNEELRGLLVRVYGAMDRADETQAILDALPEEPTEPPPSIPAADESEEPSEPPAWTLRPVLDAEAHRAGRYRLRLANRSPLGSLDEYADRYGIEVDEIRSNDDDAGSYRIEDETFEVFVPPGYASDTPHTLFVWVSPTPFGGTEREEFQKVLSDRDMIWIGANNGGNERSRWDRTSLALDAAAAMLDLYNIDAERVWVGGYSGGGRVSGGLVTLYPEVFRGGLFVMGCDFYRDLPVADHPGAVWPAAFREPNSKTLRTLRRERRYVILTGTRDFNVSKSRTVHQAYLDQDFRHVQLLVVPGMSHYDPVPAEWWQRAFAFLAGEDDQGKAAF
jgi:tetratricopeptide (TPR) repeat protein